MQSILTVLISSWINFFLAAVPFTLISTDIVYQNIGSDVLKIAIFNTGYLVKFGYIVDFLLSIVSMIPLVWLLVRIYHPKIIHLTVCGSYSDIPAKI